MADDTIRPTHSRVKTGAALLFNPFQYIAGIQALLVGLALIIATIYVGSLSQTHFDGVLDVHSGLAAPTWFFLVEVLIDWLSLAILLTIAGLITARSRFRLIDVVGTEALARAPMLLTATLFLLPQVQRFLEYLVHKLPALTASPGSSPADLWKDLPLADLAVFVLATLIMLLMIVWMVALMYRGYAVSCNLRGSRAVISFTIALIVAEAVSKLAIIWLARTAQILS